jgi:hypothetical protein
MAQQRRMDATTPSLLSDICLPSPARFTAIATTAT